MIIVELLALRKKHGEKTIAQVKVDDAVLGMRGLPLMLYDGSALDPQTGITFRGHTIPEFCENAQKAQEELSLFLKLCFIYCSPANIPTINNSMNFPMNGNTEEI